MSGRFEFRDIMTILIIAIFCLIASAFLYGRSALLNLVTGALVVFGILSMITFFYMLGSGGE